jgi:hypothetical protein
VSWGSGRLDIFARGANGDLLHKFFQGNWGPNAMEVVGTGIAGDPVAVSWGSGRLDIFACGANGDLLHKFFEGGWGPDGMGGPLEVVGSGRGIGGRPAAVSWGSGRLDIFGRAQDGDTLHNLLHKYFGGRWEP